MSFRKSLPSFLFIVILALPVFPCVLGLSIDEELWIVYHHGVDHGGLEVIVEATPYIYPGETMSLNVTVRAGLMPVHISQMNLNISGLADERNVTLLGSSILFEGLVLGTNETGQHNYELTVPDNISPGATLGSISYEWTVMGLPADVPTTAFIGTYVRNKEFAELRDSYQELNQTYTSLQENYTKSEIQFSEELAGTRNMMYVLIVVALVSVASLFFLIRRPKNWW